MLKKKKIIIPHIVKGVLRTHASDFHDWPFNCSHDDDDDSRYLNI